MSTLGCLTTTIYKLTFSHFHCVVINKLLFNYKSFLFHIVISALLAAKLCLWIKLWFKSAYVICKRNSNKSFVVILSQWSVLKLFLNFRHCFRLSFLCTFLRQSLSPHLSNVDLLSITLERFFKYFEKRGYSKLLVDQDVCLFSIL